MRPLPHFALALAFTAATLACIPLDDPPEPAAAAPAELALLGLNGRRLASGETYHLPLDAPDRALALRRPHREALALENRGGSPLHLEAAWLTPTGATLPGELRLLAPTLAAPRPFSLPRAALAPGERLPLDIGADLLASGPRGADLTVRWSEGADLVVHLAARGAGAERLAPSPEPLPGPQLAPPTAAPLAALAFAADGARGLSRPDAASALPAAVTRFTPSGAAAWTTALASAGAARFDAAGLCASPAGSTLVTGTWPTAPGGRALAVAALDALGHLRWARTLPAEPARPSGDVRCAVSSEVLWLAAPVREDDARREGVLLAALRLADGAELARWRLSGDSAEPLGVAAVVRGPDGGAVALGGAGKAGWLVALSLAGARAYDLPGPGLAAAVSPAGEPLIAWREGRATALARLAAHGELPWTVRAPLTGPVALTADAAEAHLGLGADGAWWVLSAGLAQGAVRRTEKLVADHALETAPAALHHDRAALWLALGARPARALWYEAALATSTSVARRLGPTTLALAPAAAEPGLDLADPLGAEPLFGVRGRGDEGSRAEAAFVLLGRAPAP